MEIHLLSENMLTCDADATHTQHNLDFTVVTYNNCSLKFSLCEIEHAELKNNCKLGTWNNCCAPLDRAQSCALLSKTCFVGSSQKQ